MLLPGLHDKSDVDFRMRFFSHGASPEKIGVTYHVIKKYNEENFIICDVSSNTVTLAITKKRIMGAIDAGYSPLESLKALSTFRQYETSMLVLKRQMKHFLLAGFLSEIWGRRR